MLRNSLQRSTRRFNRTLHRTPPLMRPHERNKKAPQVVDSTGLAKWEWRDLNPQPMDYESTALTD